jgi:hypothetical protein
MSVGIDWTSHALHCGEDSEPGGIERVANRNMKRKMVILLPVTLIFPLLSLSLSLSLSSMHMYVGTGG